jgi:hypothetical protein
MFFIGAASVGDDRKYYTETGGNSLEYVSAACEIGKMLVLFCVSSEEAGKVKPAMSETAKEERVVALLLSERFLKPIF